MPARKIRRYGWRPSLPDVRDVSFAPRFHRLSLPKSVDLRHSCPGVYDQGDLGSCTANALAGLHEFLQKHSGSKTPFTPSRLFIYYNERAREGTVSQDAGADLRDGMKSLAAQGAPPEALWWYDAKKFAVKPNQAVYAAAQKHRLGPYETLRDGDLYVMKASLAEGFPFVFGFTAYESFESDAVARSGVLEMPTKHETVVGGHAVMAVGFDDASQRFLVRNSWGKDWGQAGYFTMPYAYLQCPDLATDFWTARTLLTA